MNLANAKTPQQSIFLDANGKPIPNEVLLFLSSSEKKIKVTNTNKAPKGKAKINSIKISSAKNKKKKPTSTPQLEEDLLNALLAGKTARASHLIRAGVKVNYQNFKGETPLSVSVDRGWASMVADLIEHGGNLRKKTSKGTSLLHHASAKGYTDLAKVLVKHGMNPSETTGKDWNSLHIAGRYGHWQLVQYYLEYGVDPNARTSDGKTALEIAQIVKHQGIVKILARVTSTRPVGWSKRYIRHENRARFQALADHKKSLLSTRRKEAIENEKEKRAARYYKIKALKEKKKN